MKKKTENKILELAQNNFFHIPIYFSNTTKTSYLTQLKRNFNKINKKLKSLNKRAFEPDHKADNVM